MILANYVTSSTKKSLYAGAMHSPDLGVTLKSQTLQLVCASCHIYRINIVFFVVVYMQK